MVPLLLIATIVACVLVDLAVVALRRRRQMPAVAHVGPAAIELESVAPPAGVFVDAGNTWMSLRADGNVRIGATALLLRALGAPEAVTLPRTGQRVKRGDPLFTVRVGGREATFRAPVGGVVAATNAEAHAEPHRLQARPFGLWLVEVSGESLAEAISRMSVAEKAAEWMRREYVRLKDALVRASTGAGGALPEAADGGAPVEGALGRLDDEAFAAVVADFLDPDADRPTH